MIKALINDGGQAFPGFEPLAAPQPFKGMSKRTYLAGQALVGLVHLCAHDTLAEGVTFEMHVARQAYKIADAMIALEDETQ